MEDAPQAPKPRPLDTHGREVAKEIAKLCESCCLLSPDASAAAGFGNRAGTRESWPWLLPLNLTLGFSFFALWRRRGAGLWAAGKTAAKAAAKGAAKAAPAAKGAAKAAPKAAPAAAGTGAAAAKEEAQTQKEASEAKSDKEDEKKKEEEAKLEEQRKAEEAEKERKRQKANGDVPQDGKITAAEIDETYCLSDEKYKMESAGEVFPYIFEEPLGTFHDLEAGETYYVFVEEDETEFLKSQEKAKQNFAGVRSAATRGEGCSCIEGNPCAQECDAQGNTICSRLRTHNCIQTQRCGYGSWKLRCLAEDVKEKWQAEVSKAKEAHHKEVLMLQIRIREIQAESETIAGPYIKQIKELELQKQGLEVQLSQALSSRETFHVEC
eukprot:g15154.t1